MGVVSKTLSTGQPTASLIAFGHLGVLNKVFVDSSGFRGFQFTGIETHLQVS